MHVKKTQKGSILIFALIMLSFILITAFTVAGVTLIERRSTTSSVNSATAFQNADKGMEEFLQQVYKSMDQNNTLNDLAPKLGVGYSCAPGVNGAPAYIGTVETEFMISAYKEGVVTAQPFTGWNGASLEPIVDCGEVLANVSRFKVIGNHKSAARAVFVKLRDSLMRGLVAHWSFEDRAQVAQLISDKDKISSFIAQDASKNDHILTLCAPENDSEALEDVHNVSLGNIKEFVDCQNNTADFMVPKKRVSANPNAAESLKGAWDDGIVSEDQVVGADGTVHSKEALYFDGNDYLAMNTKSTCTSSDGYNCVPSIGDKLKLTDGISISLWVKTAGQVSTQSMLVSRHKSTDKGYHIYIDANGKFCFEVNAAKACTNDNHKYDDKNWHHVVGRWQKKSDGLANSVEIIVDNEKRDSGINKVSQIMYNNDLLCLGAASDHITGYFTGWIDDVRIWDRMILDEEVNRLCVMAWNDVSKDDKCLPSPL